MKYYPNQHVHVDTDNAEWGRVASDGTVLELTQRRTLVEYAFIQANIWIPKADIGPKE